MRGTSEDQGGGEERGERLEESLDQSFDGRGGGYVSKMLIQSTVYAVYNMHQLSDMFKVQRSIFLL